MGAMRAAEEAVLDGVTDTEPERAEDLLVAYVQTRSPELRAGLVARYEGVARALARRMARRAPDREDVTQVAMVGLLHALDRFDPARGVSFTTYAWATIVGEIKRHYRRSGWDVHVSRRAQEAYLRSAAAVDELTQTLGRSPTVSEIAHRTGDSEEDVIGSLEVQRAYRSLSLDASEGEDGDSLQLADRYDAVGEFEQRDALQFLLSRLPAREREVVRLRFVEELSQAAIAGRLGISQMHVSRLLAQSLTRLRALASAGFSY